MKGTALAKRLLLLVILSALFQGGCFLLSYGLMALGRSSASPRTISDQSSHQPAPILKTPVVSAASSTQARAASGSKTPAAATSLAPILMYHYIEEPKATATLKGLYVKPAAFEKQLQELARGGYETVFVSEIAQDLRAGKKPSAKSVALTFDDGYEDFYAQAFPLLQKYQAKATVYVIVNALDRPGYLSRAQLKELSTSGLVEIGSHTFNHPDLRQKKWKDADFEIRASRQALAELTGQPILTFAYPFGYHDQVDQEIASSSGYLGAVSVLPGSRHSVNDIWLLKRLRPNERIGFDFWYWLEDWMLAPKEGN